MTYLLDTSAVLAHIRDELGTERVQQLFEEENSSVFLCCVTLAELARSLRELGATSLESWEKIEEYLLVVDEVVSVDSSVARESDRLTIAAEKPLPLVDGLIAASACIKGAVLVHRDAHLRSIPADLLSQLDLADEGEN